MIGMHFGGFITVLWTSVIGAVVVHYILRYKFLGGIDGFFGKWVAAWICAWLASPVLGHWFGHLVIAGVYLIPAIIGGFVGAFSVTAVLKAWAKAFQTLATVTQPKSV